MLLLIGFKDKNFVTNNSDYFDLVNMVVFLFVCTENLKYTFINTYIYTNGYPYTICWMKHCRVSNMTLALSWTTIERSSLYSS